MVNHGFATGALFLVAGFLISRRGSQLIADYGGVQKVAPGAGRALPDRRPGHARRCRACPPSSASSWSWSAPSHATRWPAIIATARHRPGRALRPVDVPAHHDRAGTAERSRACRDLNGRGRLVVVAPLIALIIAPRLLPQAAARHDQPGGHMTLHAGAQHRPGAAHRGSRHRLQKGTRRDATLAAAARDRRADASSTASSSPMLLVFGAAIVGVLVEAFAPRASLRTSIQLPLTLLALVGAFAADRRARGQAAGTTRRRPPWARSRSTAPRCSSRAPSCSLAVRRRAADRRAPSDGDAFAAQAAAVPGSATRSARPAAGGLRTTEVFPLIAVRGRRHAALPRLERPADHVRRRSRSCPCRCTCCAAWPAAAACSRRRRR